MNVFSKPPVDVQYVGLPGLSASCKEAVMRFIQFGDRISSAGILTAGTTHCLLLRMEAGEFVAVRKGFASGYNGEGPRTFSFVLSLLRAHGVEIEEYVVDSKTLDRIDSASLSVRDIDTLAVLPPVRPMRWHEYIFDADVERNQQRTLWKEMPPVMPFAVIDGRIMDLALRFFENPDESLLTGYRRLEDLVRTRTGLTEHSAKLFSQAFLGNNTKLEWTVKDPSEQVGRGTFFTAVYQTYRNPRAHRESEHRLYEQLVEFLSLNHLFLLEKTAVDKP